jgi:hypothetical protein
VKPEPNFFLVGAARAGTTALWNRLRQHPDVYMPLESKEPHFFSDVQPPWAIRSWDDYLALFAGAGEVSAIGEASAGYLMAPEVPARIRSQFRDARIIIMLRDPAERAYSLYRLNCSFGIERLQTFEEALRSEEARLNDSELKRAFEEALRSKESRLNDSELKRASAHYHACLLYFRSALMTDAVRRYLSTFPAGRVHVLLFDDFIKNPRESIEEVYRFLAVDPHAPARPNANGGVLPEDLARNGADLPLWVNGQHHLCRWWTARVIRRGGLQMDRVDRWFDRLTTANRRLGRRFRASAMNPKTRQELVERYTDDIRATSDLIGRDLRMWLK